MGLRRDLAQMRFRVAPVEEAGQRVGHRRMQAVAQGVAQPVLVHLVTQDDLDAQRQFVAADLSQHHAVGPQIEQHRPRLRLLARQKDHLRREPGGLAGPQVGDEAEHLRRRRQRRMAIEDEQIGHAHVGRVDQRAVGRDDADALIEAGLQHLCQLAGRDRIVREQRDARRRQARRGRFLEPEVAARAVAHLQFARHVAPPHQAAHPCQKQRVADRARQHVVRPGIERVEPGDAGVERTDGDDRDVRGRRLGPELAAEAVAVFGFVGQVDQDQVRRIVGDARPGLCAGGDGVHIVFRSQHLHPQDDAVGRDAVDDQYSTGHLAIPKRRFHHRPTTLPPND